MYNTVMVSDCPHSNGLSLFDFSKTSPSPCVVGVKSTDEKSRMVLLMSSAWRLMDSSKLWPVLVKKRTSLLKPQDPQE